MLVDIEKVKTVGQDVFAKLDFMDDGIFQFVPVLVDVAGTARVSITIFKSPKLGPKD